MPDHRSGVACADHDRGVRPVMRLLAFVLRSRSSARARNSGGRCDLHRNAGRSRSRRPTRRIASPCAAFGASCDKAIGLYEIHRRGRPSDLGVGDAAAARVRRCVRGRRTGTHAARSSSNGRSRRSLTTQARAGMARAGAGANHARSNSHMTTSARAICRCYATFREQHGRRACFGSQRRAARGICLIETSRRTMQ